MEKMLFKEKFPLYTTTLGKEKSMDDLVAYFQEQIEKHPVAGFITVFDHYGYTTAKEEHSVADGIIDVKNVIFCFGKEIAHPNVPAVRPRSIAIVEMEDSFVVSFLEAPMEPLTQVMIGWVEALA